MEVLKKKLKHWPLLVTKASWPWRLEEKLVLSRLYYAARKERGLGPKQLSNETGLDYKTVVAALERLATADLVRFENGKWHGCEPDERHPYLVRGAPSKHWASSLVCFPCFVPVEKRNLRAAAMFSLLIDLCRQHCGVVKKVTPAYLALLLGVSDKSAAKYVKQLQAAGLIKVYEAGDRVDVKCCLEELLWFEKAEMHTSKEGRSVEKAKPSSKTKTLMRPELPKTTPTPPSSLDTGAVPKSVRFVNETSQKVFEFLKSFQIPMPMARDLTKRWARLGIDAEPFAAQCESKANYVKRKFRAGESQVSHPGFLIQGFLRQLEKMEETAQSHHLPTADEVLPPITPLYVKSVLIRTCGIPNEEAATYADRIAAAGCDLDDVCLRISNTPFIRRSIKPMSAEQRSAWIDRFIGDLTCAG